MVILGSLKTKTPGTALGLAEKTPKKMTIKSTTNNAVIIRKNVYCLCFGDIKTTAMFNMNARLFAG